jgi:DNA-nicking Smr family endonuclease
MSRRGRERQPSRDEIALWRHAMRDALPLDGRAVAAPPPVPQPEPAVPTPASPPPEPARPVVPSRPPSLAFQPVPHGIDRRTLQRLKRGLVSIDARLDLHGMTQEEAHRHLTLFLAHHQRQGARCILVITGIGERTTGGTLRRMTPRWLAEPVNAARIIAYSPAQKRHGGEGALYVLLRRLR